MDKNMFYISYSERLPLAYTGIPVSIRPHGYLKLPPNDDWFCSPGSACVSDYVLLKQSSEYIMLQY